MKLRLNSLRNLVAIGYDAAAAGAAFVAALYLRWSELMWVYAESYVWRGTMTVSIVMVGLVLYTRLYRRFWRYLSLKDITTILKVSFVTLVVFYAIFFMTTRLEMLPRSVPIIHGLLLLSFMIGPRVLYRAIHERRLQLPEQQQVPVLLVGATAEAESFIRESMRSTSFSYRAVGVVATEEKSVGRNIHHVKIYSDVNDIPAVVRKLKRKGDAPQRLIIADMHLSGETIAELLELAKQESISLARMPRLSDLTRGDKSPFDVRPIDVEDILGRPQATLDVPAMEAVVRDKVVLVTGAGGSIGSELCRQIASFAPRQLIFYEQNEYALYSIDREIRESNPVQPRRAILGDVRNRDQLDRTFAEFRPQVVFHAAALKHVPLCEINVAEAILTNVIGTQNVADTCLASSVELMVQISTDKAVNPTNVMGACKRIGESYCQMLGQTQDQSRFVTVRFGNVLGSTGSVVPLFQHQLEQGGPITVTHPEMTRYFMTTREAVQLVMQAAALSGDVNQPAPIFVLDMGKPVRIVDLARQMIQLSGLRPDEDIEILFTGLRPGEKLHEELFYAEEALQPTQHSAIQLAEAQEITHKHLLKHLDALYKAAKKHEDTGLVALLQMAVPDYQPLKKKESA